MSEMVERVARAILSMVPDGYGMYDDEARQYARAAIEAMREPTEAMLKYAFVEMNRTPSGEWKRMKASGATPRQIFDSKMIPRWRAMIDEALK